MNIAQSEPTRSVMALPEIPSVRAYKVQSLGDDLRFLQALRQRIGWLLPEDTSKQLDGILTLIVQKLVSV